MAPMLMRRPATHIKVDRSGQVVGVKGSVRMVIGRGVYQGQRQPCPRPPRLGLCQPGTGLAPATHMSRIVRHAALIPAIAAMFAIHVSVAAAQPTVSVENQADLSVSLSGGSGTIGQGDVFNLFVQFQNAGPLAASDVTVLVDLPLGLEYAGGGCAATPSVDIRCDLGEVQAMTAGIEIVNVRAVDAGVHTIGATISSSTPDPDPSDNSDSLDVTVEAREADLSTTVTDLADPVKPGRTVTYMIEITNGGPSTATDVTAEVGWTTTSAGKVDLMGLSATGASCVVAAQQQVTCQTASLTAGDSIVIELPVRPRGPCEVSVTAGASAAEPDPNSANNTDTETTRIGAQ